MENIEHIHMLHSSAVKMATCSSVTAVLSLSENDFITSKVSNYSVHLSMLEYVGSSVGNSANY